MATPIPASNGSFTKIPSKTRCQGQPLQPPAPPGGSAFIAYLNSPELRAHRKPVAEFASIQIFERDGRSRRRPPAPSGRRGPSKRLRAKPSGSAALLIIPTPISNSTSDAGSGTAVKPAPAPRPRLDLPKIVSPHDIIDGIDDAVVVAVRIRRIMKTTPGRAEGGSPHVVVGSVDDHVLVIVARDDDSRRIDDEQTRVSIAQQHSL